MDEIGREHFDEKFGGRPVAVQPAFCLNSRFKAAGCTLCVDGCPAEAIALEGARPTLDPAACVQCGACLAVCPTDVFSQFPSVEDALVKTVAARPAGDVALACTLHPNAATSPAPVATIVEHKHCLASLAVDRLLALCDRVTGRLWIDDTPCAACPLGATHGQLSRTVSAANSLLRAAGHRAAIQLLAETAHTAPVQSRPRAVIDGSQPPLSRRALFGLARQHAADSRRNSQETAAPASGRDLPPAQRLPHVVPPSRRRLRQWWSAAAAEGSQEIATEGLPFANLAVDAAACSACGLCSRFCPTGALVFTTDCNTFELGFQAALCLGCNICTIACPSGAVQLGPTLSVAMLMADTPARVASGALLACATCGQPTAAHGATEGGPLCHVCSSAAQAPSIQADRRRSLFDNLTTE